MLFSLIQAMRPYQWTKNLLVLAALVFAHRGFDSASVRTGFMAFAVFCLASSAMYVLNDLVDIDQDRAHPRKRTRPFASGALSQSTGWAMVAVLYFL